MVLEPSPPWSGGRHGAWCRHHARVPLCVCREKVCLSGSVVALRRLRTAVWNFDSTCSGRSRLCRMSGDEPGDLAAGTSGAWAP